VANCIVQGNTNRPRCNHETRAHNDNKDEPKLAEEAVVVAVRDDLKGPVVHESLSVLDGTAAAREKDLERQMSPDVSMELETKIYNDSMTLNTARRKQPRLVLLVPMGSRQHPLP
jgi:hypothetical protein